MRKLLGAFFDIALRRGGPEDLPASSFLLWLTAAVYVVFDVASIVLNTQDPVQIGAQLMLDLGFLLVFFWVLLAFYGFRHRYQQTLIALLGISALFALLFVPLSVWLDAVQPEQVGATVLTLSLYAVLLWWLSIAGHIVSRAIEIPYFSGIMVAVVYFIAQIAIFVRLFPDAA